MRYYSHLNTAASILDAYNGSVPFHHFLRDFLRASKKYGSADRRNISRLCYVTFRLGKAFPDWSISDRMLAGLLLCTNSRDNLTDFLLPAKEVSVEASVDYKWSQLASLYANGKSPSTFSVDDLQENQHETTPGIESIFPSHTGFSPGLNSEAFHKSFFTQPDLFIRIRPGKAKSVTQKLRQHNILFETLPPDAVRLPAGTKLEEIFIADRDIVIQDYSSQRTAELLSGLAPKTVWDACAASGGKSLLVWDMLNRIELTVSDVRSSIIVNLRKRFQQAGIARYKAAVADLSTDAPLPFLVAPDLVIADLPCSGSGTWSRTPEQLAFFEPASIEYYQQLQQKILRRLSKQLSNGAHMLFITCSVFKSENEDNVTFMEEQLGLKCLRQQLITGYEHRADTMFAALLQSKS